MPGSSSKSKPTRVRKRVEAETSLKRARDGSAFTRCEACNKDVSVALIDMHDCSLDLKVRMNLESDVVERISEVKKPLRKKSAPSEKPKKVQKEKKVKDPNMPKRPPTTFFLFMYTLSPVINALEWDTLVGVTNASLMGRDDFRKEYKVAHLNSKGVAVVAQEGGEKWKSMTDEEKKPYIDKTTELKAEYEKAVDKYTVKK
ncbi:High mobility group B protein 7 [Acorus calamus]|uniref:High mobility group B protein 7 n=1 Tax=Acorus calamus TaxID=4465 RepID=A0AAV9DV84_ACOCL|nr:High mobility group B protein 7 [Acorus calamus]